MSSKHNLIQSYFFPILLLTSIIFGGVFGNLLGPDAQCLKPLGDIFLNLIFTAIVPLIFFSVSAAIARLGSVGKFGKIIFYMLIVFLFTGTVAGILSLFLVKIFPPAQGISLQLALPKQLSHVTFSDQMVTIFTVPDFSKLLSHTHMLALIVFSSLVGIAATLENKEGKSIVSFLQAGETLFMRVFSLIMYYAPIGFFAYFAVLVSELGPQLMGNYFRIAIIYYVFSLLYFIIIYSLYAYWSGKKNGLIRFWQNIFLPMITSVATCSSAASIPANLVATKAMNISPEIYETIIPLGTMIHKEGSIIGGIIKIAFLFGIFHLDFSGVSVMLTALGVSLLVGTVMGAIPSGGMLGELLILTFYGFPTSALMTIAAISIIIDPLATLLNVTGNSISSMMVARLMKKDKTP